MAQLEMGRGVGLEQEGEDETGKEKYARCRKLAPMR
jgi:hypothetical protein